MQTPATFAVKQITTLVKDILLLVSDCVQNLESIKIALSSLMLIVSNVNKGVAQKSKDDSVGFDQAITLNTRTNALFTKLLSSWLVSEKAVNYFIFELKGFEFLLDTISCDKTDDESAHTVPSADVKSVVRSALIKSDLGTLVKQWQKEKGSTKDASTTATTTTTAVSTTTAKTMTEENKDTEDKFSVPLQEIANQITLLKTSAQENVSSYARTDWSANKRANKSKIFTSSVNVSKQLEYKMLFKLPFVSLLREIQVSFFNYWANESVPEPIYVGLHAGMDEKDAMDHVFTLEKVRDNGLSQT